MSVDHGFRFATSDLSEVHRLMMGFRPEIRRLSFETRLRSVVDKAVSTIDAAVLTGEGAPSPLSSAFDAFQDRLNGIGRGRPAADIDQTFSVCVMPWEGRIYGSIHTFRHEWARHLLERPWVEPFDYTDSTDQDEIPRAEYATRRDVWEGICRQDPGTRLSGCGFKVEFHPSVDAGTPEEIMALVPDIARRARLQARNAVILERAASISEGGPNTMQTTIRAAMWFTEDEGQAAAKAEAERISPLLPTLTWALLTEGPAAREGIGKTEVGAPS